MPPIIWIITGLIVILSIGPIGILGEKIIHWLMRRMGVTELKSRQRRGFAKGYKETTGRRFTKKRKRINTLQKRNRGRK
jgi:hypothetical protein